MKQTIITLLLAIVSLSSYAQKEITVSGTVTDMDGEPLIGVTIKVPGSSTGSVSDLDGNFSVKVPDNTKAGLQDSDGGCKSRQKLENKAHGRCQQPGPGGCHRIWRR